MDVDIVRKKLDYFPATGEFSWKNGRVAGCTRKDGYRVIRVNDILMYAHRLAWLYVYGKWPGGLIDHINGVTGDNRIVNLRDATPTLNSENCHVTLKPSNKSGFRGVQKNHAGWQAVISVKGKRCGLGTFSSPEDAHAVYLHAKRRLHEGCTV